MRQVIRMLHSPIKGNKLNKGSNSFGGKFPYLFSEVYATKINLSLPLAVKKKKIVAPFFR